VPFYSFFDVDLSRHKALRSFYFATFVVSRQINSEDYIKTPLDIRLAFRFVIGILEYCMILPPHGGANNCASIDGNCRLLA
jgi:hypothetical protein